jgi:hypothetical protein
MPTKAIGPLAEDTTPTLICASALPAKHRAPAAAIKVGKTFFRTMEDLFVVRVERLNSGEMRSARFMPHSRSHSCFLPRLQR